MDTQIRACVQKFTRDRSGSIAILFGLSALILFGAAGAAIDTGRAVVASARMTTALDAASLAAAKALRTQNLSTLEVEQVAKAVFDANLEGNVGTTSVDVTSFNVSVDRDNAAVRIDMQARMDTLLARVIGVDVFSFPRSSAAIFDTKDIEVAVQLDVTGSMCDPCTKIDALKSATKSMVDILIPDEPTAQKVRVAFAPFSAGVNAGPYATAVTDGAAASAGSNCVYERANETAYQLSDEQPTIASRLLARNEVNTAGRGDCSNGAEILPLTDDKDTLKSTVDGYSTGGYTAGHIGTAWAWYLLSPKWNAIWPSDAEPAAYNDGKTKKVAILMTDGEYNTFNGYSNASKSETTAKDTCAAMKNAGITVYTVGFELAAGSTAEDIMKSCASAPAKFCDAGDAAGLKACFEAIAVDISRLRLSS